MTISIYRTGFSGKRDGWLFYNELVIIQLHRLQLFLLMEKDPGLIDPWHA